MVWKDVVVDRLAKPIPVWCRVAGQYVSGITITGPYDGHIAGGPRRSTGPRRRRRSRVAAGPGAPAGERLQKWLARGQAAPPRDRGGSGRTSSTVPPPAWRSPCRAIACCKTAGRSRQPPPFRQGAAPAHHKPVGEVTTARSAGPAHGVRIVAAAAGPAGSSSGASTSTPPPACCFTNDGRTRPPPDASPRAGAARVPVVRVREQPTPATLARLAAGVQRKRWAIRPEAVPEQGSDGLVSRDAARGSQPRSAPDLERGRTRGQPAGTDRYGGLVLPRDLRPATSRRPGSAQEMAELARASATPSAVSCSGGSSVRPGAGWTALAPRCIGARTAAAPPRASRPASRVHSRRHRPERSMLRRTRCARPRVMLALALRPLALRRRGAADGRGPPAGSRRDRADVKRQVYAGRAIRHDAETTSRLRREETC